MLSSLMFLATWHPSWCGGRHLPYLVVTLYLSSVRLLPRYFREFLASYRLAIPIPVSQGPLASNLYFASDRGKLQSFRLGFSPGVPSVVCGVVSVFLSRFLVCLRTNKQIGKMAVNTMDAIKKKMQAMKLEKESALDKADQLEQKLTEQRR